MDFKLKQKTEDFSVKEVMNLKLEGGRFAYYRLFKKGYTTQKAVEIIAKKMGVRTKFVNFSGNKDKDAVTEQYVSVLHGKKINLDLGNIRLEYLGQGRKRINLGEHKGNEFEIVVRNITKKPKKIKWFVNYFDVQRFGKNLNNQLVGKLIIQKKFREACKLLPETKEHLEKHKNDFVGALRTIPKRTLRLLCNSYQSYLWNIIVSEILKTYKHRVLVFPLGNLAVPARKVKNRKIWVPGFSSELNKEEKAVLKREGVKKQDFRVKEMPELFLPGNPRDMIIDISPEIGKLERDELNKNKKKCKVRFFLPKGSYATMALKHMFIGKQSNNSFKSSN
ncbi:MAG: hypothetical protein DRP16_01560 [Candidatus Aenigmatarchaeota archaeon]|nr:MAG: hypothetical protein DRP16_01560 [Candidatus Aenigmarchaeota archaeon]